MITVELAPCRVRVTGHAGAGPYGRDLVCAGASTLVYALAARLEELAEQGQVRELRTVLQVGEAELQWSDKSGPRAAESTGATAFFAAGMRMLEEEYPGFVRVV